MKAYLNQNGRCGRRGGFTVVEILVAITVIAILAAMLIPVVGGAMRRANEFAIQAEMSQLDMAIEQFKTDNGFYPPSFRSINGAADLMPYLNRIAPNHAYTPNQLADWWSNVGEHVEHHGGADLVFWLSGIAKNKQYPLGDPSDWLAPHDYDPTENPKIERAVYFEFASDRLNFDDDGSGAANYLQAKGKQRDQQGSEAVYLYLDAGSYGNGNGGYCLNDGSGFFNPDSFQLFSPGLDGNKGNVLPNGTPANKCLTPGLDNIVNFIGEGTGKLETKALGID